MDISAPFLKSKVRFRLFEETNGFESLVDELAISLADIDSDHPHRAHDLDYEKVTSLQSSMRVGEVDGWFPFEGTGDDDASVGASNRRRSSINKTMRSSQTASVKNSRWDKIHGPSSPHSPHHSTAGGFSAKASHSHSVHLVLYAQRPDKEKARERARERKQKMEKLEKKRSFTLEKKISNKSFSKSPKSPPGRKKAPFELETRI